MKSFKEYIHINESNVLDKAVKSYPVDSILQKNKSRKTGDIALDEESNDIPKSKILSISSSRMEIGTPDSSSGGVYVEIYSKLRGYSSFSVDSETLKNIKKFF